MGRASLVYKSMTERDKILTEIETFMANEGISPRQFGIRAMGDSGFVYRLRQGLDIKARTLDRVRAFMQDYRSGPKKKLKA